MQILDLEGPESACLIRPWDSSRTVNFDCGIGLSGMQCLSAMGNGG